MQLSIPHHFLFFLIFFFFLIIISPSPLESKQHYLKRYCGKTQLYDGYNGWQRRWIHPSELFNGSHYRNNSNIQVLWSLIPGVLGFPSGLGSGAVPRRCRPNLPIPFGVSYEHTLIGGPTTPWAACANVGMARQGCTHCSAALREPNQAAHLFPILIN